MSLKQSKRTETKSDSSSSTLSKHSDHQTENKVKAIPRQAIDFKISNKSGGVLNDKTPVEVKVPPADSTAKLLETLSASAFQRKTFSNYDSSTSTSDSDVDSNLDSRSSTRSLARVRSSNMQLKPVYVLDSSPSAAYVTEDRLASYAYGFVAYTKARQEASQETLMFSDAKPSFDFGASAQRLPTSDQDMRIAKAPLAAVSDLRWHTSKVSLYESKRKDNLQVIESYVLKAPYMYDSHFASYGGRKMSPRIHSFRSSNRGYNETNFPGDPMMSLKQSFSSFPVQSNVPSLIPSASSAPKAFVPAPAPAPAPAPSPPGRRESGEVTLRALPSKDKTDLKAKSSDILGENLQESSQDLSTLKVKIIAGKGDSEASDYYSVASKFNNFSASLVPLPAGTRSRRRREKFLTWRAGHKLLPKTEETGHIASHDFISQERQVFLQDSRDIFKKNRIPVLRRSPAYIMWPRPSGGKAPPRVCSDQTMKGNETSAVIPTPGGVASPSGSLDSVPEITESGDDLPLGGIWPENSKYGRVRLDQHGIGSPRFYHWAPYNQQLVQEMRCRVMTAATRPVLPPINRKALAFVLPDSSANSREKLAQTSQNPKKRKLTKMLL